MGPKNKVEYAINNTVQCRLTGETPSKLLFGVDQLGEVSDSLRLILDPNSSEDRDLPSIRNSASERIAKCQEQNEDRYNQKRKEAKCYREGDYVMIRNIDTSAGGNKKLIPKYKGPYIVKRVLRFDRYEVGDIDGFQITQKPYAGVVPADQMRPYIRE